MYHRYLGNTGQFIRVEDEAENDIITSPAASYSAANEGLPLSRPKQLGGAASLNALPSLKTLLPSLNLDGADIILALLFLYLYMQSGDWEFLILLGAIIVL